MKKQISQSLALRRRLLFALISCLLAVLGICTFMFHIIYQQATLNVDRHSSLLSKQTISIVSDAYYQQYLSTMQDDLCHFGDQRAMEQSLEAMQKELYGEYYEEDTTPYHEVLLNCAQGYFGNTFDIFMTFDGETLRCYDLHTGEEGSAVVNAAFSALDAKVKAEEFYGNPDSFYDYLSHNWEKPFGIYTKSGDGYIVAWETMYGYTEHHISCGLLRYEINQITIQPIVTVAGQQTEILLENLDVLFKKNTYIMLAAIICVFMLFLLISTILSKKLSDPVISEHDMLVQVNEMKTTFLSDASHELKTPLAAMSGYAQDAELDLMRGEERTQIQEKLKRISSEANHMALMVTQILDATRIEEGRMVLQPSVCDLESLVRETIETYFAVLNKNNNRLMLRIPVELPKIEADQARLQRVFVNLISNALKHTKNGKILIKAEANEDTMTVTVKDTGSGISPEDLPHIWERYYKGKQSETGTGLGLYICKFIIESHGGTINVESEVGKGTAFFFTLPLTNPEMDFAPEPDPLGDLLRQK